MDIDQEHLGIPETNYDAEVLMSSSEFQKICRDLTVLGESVKIEVSKEGVRFSAEGEIGAGSVFLKPTSVGTIKQEVKDEDNEDEDAEEEHDDDDDDGSPKKKPKVKVEKKEVADMDEDEDEEPKDDEDESEIGTSLLQASHPQMSVLLIFAYLSCLGLLQRSRRTTTSTRSLRSRSARQTEERPRRLRRRRQRCVSSLALVSLASSLTTLLRFFATCRRESLARTRTPAS